MESGEALDALRTIAAHAATLADRLEGKPTDLNALVNVSNGRIAQWVLGNAIHVAEFFDEAAT